MNSFLRLLPAIEFAIGISMALFFFTQIVLPWLEQRPLFPWFNKRRRKLELLRTEAAERLSEAEIKTDTESLRRAARALDRRTNFATKDGEKK